MSLQNSFYIIVDQKSLGVNSWSYTIRFEASHPIFAGHFPGQPVVPGACLVQIAEELLRIQTGQKIRFNSVRNLKFRHPVLPDREVVYTIEDHPSQIQCQIADSASFTATYMCDSSDVQ